MRVLLLSAYAAGSHVHWRESLLAMFPEWQWQVLELPPRHFSWRVRGNPLSWAVAERDVLEGDYDLLLATSMVDLATLRGLVPSLGAVPAALYFHENQFAYPVNDRQSSLLEAQMVSLYSALAADRLLFNSRYNHDSFFAGLSELLDRLPDHVPPGVVASLQSRAAVLPVPLFQAKGTANQPTGAFPGAGPYPQRPLRLLWTGRFEYDRGGDGLLAVLRLLEAEGIDYRLAVVGQRFRDSPQAFARIEREFATRLVQFGYLPDRGDYLALLAQADIVLGTSLHEFQGLAVLEAVQQGCVPLMPSRLAYPELFAPEFLYASDPGSPASEARSALAGIRRLALGIAGGGVSAPDVTGYSIDALAPAYRQELLQLLAPAA